MKWKKYVLIAGALTINNLAPLQVWAQTGQQVAPATKLATVDGEIQDAQTKTPVAGATILAKSEDGVVRDQQITTKEGHFQLRLDPKLSYILTIKADGYITLDEQQTFSSPTVDSQHKKVPIYLFRVSASSVQKVLAPSSSSVRPPAATAKPPATTSSVTRTTSPATPPATGQTIAAAAPNANNARVAPPKTLDAKVIYTPPLIVAPLGKATQLQALQFVQSQAELLPDAKPAMEQLVAFMNEHPTAEIELAGHTDNQGDFDKNLLLSKQRVDTVKDYLVKSGIAAGRITTRGFGPTRPIASNNREETRQLNRRVEMTVVKQ